MALQSTASTSDPIKLSEVKTEFAYWVTSNNLTDFLYNGIGPAGGVYENTTPPNNALNLTSFLGKEGGGTFSYSFTGNQWKKREEDQGGGQYSTVGYFLTLSPHGTVLVYGDLPNAAADYYDHTDSGNTYRYFRGKSQTTVDNGDIRDKYYAISRVQI